MIFSKETLNLVFNIENGANSIQNFSNLIKFVDSDLKNSQQVITKLSKTEVEFSQYPIDNEFAVAFCPLTQSEELLEYWYRYGFVVGKDVVKNEQTDNVIQKMLLILNQVSMNNESSYIKDDNETPFVSRGFFELYHDNCLAQIRQSVRLYLYHSLLWNSAYLWTTFDRLGLKTPTGESSKGLNLHVDQNPNVHRGFTTIQGVLALEDCPIDRGTFVVVPGSLEYFDEYQKFINPEYKGEFVPLEEDSYLFEYLSRTQQKIPLRKNNIVSYDSRTTHANSDNISNQNRYVFYISTGLAQENNYDLINIRKNAFQSGLGENKRDAYLHASKKPRFTNEIFINSIRDKEQLTILGECLYGLKSYKELK